MGFRPKHSLNKVFEIIKNGDLDNVVFSVPEKSTFSVISVFSDTKPKSYSQAVEFILNGMLSLREEDFVHRQCLFDDLSCIADVYGVNYESRPWYVKFYIEDGKFLEQVSFHPPEREMITITGIKIPKGDYTYEKMRKLWIKRTK